MVLHESYSRNDLVNKGWVMVDYFARYEIWKMGSTLILWDPKTAVVMFIAS